MPKDHSQTRKVQEMFRVVERFRDSGLTQKSFCKTEGVALSTLQYWISRYKKQNRQNQQSGSGFPELFVELKPQSSKPSFSNTIVVSYPSGVKLTLHKDVDVTLLKELIAL